MIVTIMRADAGKKIGLFLYAVTKLLGFACITQEKLHYFCLGVQSLFLPQRNPSELETRASKWIACLLRSK